MPEDIPDFGETHDYDDHRIPNVDDYKEVIAYGRQELGQLVDNWYVCCLYTFIIATIVQII